MEKPESWLICRFSEIACVISGRNQKAVESPNGEFPIYGSGGVFGKATDYLCEPGTTVIGRKGTINSPIFVNERFWNVDTAFGLCPIDKTALLPDLFYYFCRGFNFKALDKSTTIPSLAKRDIEAIHVPLPPLNEQKRIVEKIEELFSEIDAGVASLQRAREQLGVYRQALLKKAFTGELTAKWRAENPDQIEPAEQLLERIRQERETRYQQQVNDWKTAVQAWEANGKEGKKPAKPKKIKDLEGTLNDANERLHRLPREWAPEKLGNLAVKITDGEHATPKRTSSGNYLLSARNVRDGYVSLENVDYIPDSELDRILKRCNPQFNDILISCSGSVGRISLVPRDLVFGLVRSVALVKFTQSLLLPKYLLYQLQSPILQKQIDEGKKATAQANLFLGPISELVTSICSLPEQKEIVRLLEAQFEAIEQNEREIAAALTRAEALRQSILKKAFSGQLVPQDPNDEPARILLERIRREKAEAGRVKKVSKKATKKRARKKAK